MVGNGVGNVKKLKEKDYLFLVFTCSPIYAVPSTIHLINVKDFFI